MKKFIASALGAAILLSSASMSVFADGVTSSVYTIDTDRNVVKGVSPFTTVQTFEANFSGGEVEVVNVDGSQMADNAYATENVYARIDGRNYRIDVDWPYDSVQYYGRDYRSDGDVIFEKASASFNSTVDGQPAMANSGFAYATSGYKLGYGDGNYASVTSNHKTTVTKRTNAVGEPIYEIANNAPRYAFLRSHYSSVTSENSAQSALTTITKGKISVTTATFKANQMGNFSIFHNTSGYATGFKGDRPFADFTYTTNPKYIPNAVHFTEDGTIKVGGTYVNGASADQRTPANTISGVTWEAGREYTVSIIQKVNDGGSRYANVYGIYLNGQKIYPYSGIATDGSHFTYNSSTGAVSMTTRGNDYKYNGGISAVLVGAAPKNADDDFKVDLSDLKVYTISAVGNYKPAMDADITLTSDDQYITIDNKAAVVTSTRGAVTASRFTNTGYKIAVNGNIIKVVSDDGLTAKTYSLIDTYDPAAVSALTQVYGSDGSVETESDGVWAKAFTFTVTPNDDTVSTVKVTAKGSNNETLKQESWTGSLSGEGNVSFGIIAATRTEGGLDGITFTPSIEID